MKRMIYLLALVAAMAASVPSFAQESGPMARQKKMFEEGKREEIRGEVIAVHRIPARNHRFVRVVAIVGTDKGTVPVFLGPCWYLRYNRFGIRRHDTLVVNGSLVDFRHHHVLIAERVRRNDSVLNLRDATGRPMWAPRAS